MSLFTEARSALWSYVKGQLTDKAEDAVKDARDYNKLEQDVRALAEQYQPHFETLSLTEEFDFEGLNAYLKAHLRQEVSACFNAPKRDQREAARRLMFNSACYYAGADTQAKKDTVQAYLNMVLEVVEHHFLEQVDGKEWFLCGRTVDETVDAVEAFLQQHATQITEQITEAIRYHGSFAEYVDDLQPPWSNKNRFHYRNPSLGFYGREQEIAELNDFLNRNEDILWMAVTGDGGVGKSKLLYHFCAQVNDRPGWKTVWLSTNSSKRLNEYRSWDYPQRLLVVADYAGEMAEQLGDWLSHLSEVAPSCRPERLRLILLEREPLGQVTPLWYQTFTSGRVRRRVVEDCADPANPCLKLEGPGDEALKRLVTDYARSKGKPEALTEDRLA
ncbi:MAG: ATP-binding protein, partial [Clostridiales bacterium]|nr:ATP-binding protein [Clostridiales bacterium]